MRFKNREEASRILAKKLSRLEVADPLVIGLPRGGVPVAAAVAKSFKAPLDVLIVRKLGFPEDPEYGFGAVTENGIYHIDDDVFKTRRILNSDLQKVVGDEMRELQRRVSAFRKTRSFPSVEGRTVFVCDDGLATGNTALAACEYLRAHGAARVVICVPVGSRSASERLRRWGAEVECLETPEPFYGVGRWYEEFPQLSDEDVIKILTQFSPVEAPSDETVLQLVERTAKPLRGRRDLRQLIDHIKNSRLVMLGEASHGTHEFYTWRALISQELIEKHGFQFIAVEGDWPPCHQVDQFIQADLRGGADRASTILKNFHRWPMWMWANREMVQMLNWLKSFNGRGDDKGDKDKISFYGLDVYSLFESIDEVLREVEKFDGDLAKRIRENYDCFRPYRRDENEYLRSLYDMPDGCRREVLDNLQALLKLRLETIAEQQETWFDAVQNARVIKNAESYYRAMIMPDDKSWNIRDEHMTETLEILLRAHGSTSKGIVWAHNTHIGDHRATDMLEHGHVNIGGLARERLGVENVSLVGFGSYSGSVVAASAWAGAVEVMNAPEAQVGSYEAIFHQASLSLNQKDFFLLFDRNKKDAQLSIRRGHRAIGVVYDPDRERNNYVPTELNKRYDAFVYFDHTQALKPLNVKSEPHEIPETYPSGL